MNFDVDWLDIDVSTTVVLLLKNEGKEEDEQAMRKAECGEEFPIIKHCIV